MECTVWYTFREVAITIGPQTNCPLKYVKTFFHHKMDTLQIYHYIDILWHILNLYIYCSIVLVVTQTVLHTAKPCRYRYISKYSSTMARAFQSTSSTQQTNNKLLISMLFLSIYIVHPSARCRPIYKYEGAGRQLIDLLFDFTGSQNIPKMLCRMLIHRK